MWDEETIRAILASSVRYTFVSATTADGHDDSVEDVGIAGTGDESARDQGIRRRDPSGFDSRPLAGTEAAVVFNRGAASGGMMVGNGRRGGDPDIESGEAVVYSPKEPTCKVWFDKDGVLHIDAKAAKDVVVNAGTAKVALHGDSTAGHHHAHGSMTGTITGTANLSTGVVTGTCVLTAGNTANATDTINIPGTRRFKGA